MANHTRRSRALHAAAPAALAAILALGVGGPARAANGRWTLELEPLYMTVYGHDRHVLTVHEIDFDAAPLADRKTAVTLDTESGPAYRGGVSYTPGPGRWGWGVGFFWFDTGQSVGDRTGAADGPAGPLDEVRFEVADGQFTSAGPGEVLFYRVLEDTDLATWTADLYALRSLAEGPESAIHLMLGLRVGDFDNDYRAVVGLQDAVGRRLDASSNYDRMMGPLVGLAGEVRRGRSTFEGALAQSVLIGSAELTTRSRDFTGPFGETPAFFAEESFKAEEDVAIPITELRIRWTYRITEHLSAGAGVDAAAWWEVPVPPGVVPIEDGNEALDENTLVFSGVSALVAWTF